MKRIDRSEIGSLIKAGTPGTIFLTVFYASPMDKAMRKTGNPYHGKGLVKECSINGCVGFDYEAAVNRLAAKEGKEQREAKGRAWGTLQSDRKVVEHKGKLYMQIMARSSTSPVYRLGKEIIPTDSVKPFLYEKGKSSTQADLDGEVICRDVAFDNILAIRVNGEEYLVADLAPVTTLADVIKAKVAAKFDTLVEQHGAALKAELDAFVKEMVNAALTGAPLPQ